MDAPRNFIFRWHMSICQISVASLPSVSYPTKCSKGFPNPLLCHIAMPLIITLRGGGGLAGAFRCGAYIWLIITIIICVRLSKLTSDLIDMHRPVEFLASAQRKIVSGNRLGIIEALLCDCHIHARMQSVPLENVCKLRDPHIAIVYPYTIVCYITRTCIYVDPQISRSAGQVLVRLRETFTFARLDRCLRIFKHRRASPNFCHGSRLLLISRLSRRGDLSEGHSALQRLRILFISNLIIILEPLPLRRLLLLLTLLLLASLISSEICIDRRCRYGQAEAEVKVSARSFTERKM